MNKREVLIDFILLQERQAFWNVRHQKTFPVCQHLQMKHRIMESKRRCGCIIVIVNVGALFTTTILHYSGVYDPYSSVPDPQISWNCESSTILAWYISNKKFIPKHITAEYSIYVPVSLYFGSFTIPYTLFLQFLTPHEVGWLRIVVVICLVKAGIRPRVKLWKEKIHDNMFYARSLGWSLS